MPNHIEATVTLEGHRGPVAAVLPHGSQLISWTRADNVDDPYLRIWDVQAGRQLFRLDYPRLYPSGMALSDDGLLATFNALGDIHLWDVSDGRLMAEHSDVNLSPIDGVAFAGRKTLTCWNSTRMQFRKTQDLSLVGECQSVPKSRHVIADDHQQVIYGGDMAAFDTQAMRLIWQLNMEITSCSKSADGNYVAITQDGRLWVIDQASGDLIHEYVEEAFINGIMPLGDGRWAGYTGLYEPRILIFEEASWNRVRSFEQFHGRVEGGTERPKRITGIARASQTHLLTWDDTREPVMCLWEIDTAKRLWSVDLPRATEFQTHVLLTCDHRYAAVYSDHASIHLYNLDTAEQVAVLDGHRSKVEGVLPWDDGRLISWSDDGTIRVWEL